MSPPRGADGLPDAPFRLRVVLVRPRNPLNIGAAARAMANFGASELAVVHPFAPTWEKAKDAAPGAERILREAKLLPLAQAVSDCDLVVGTSSARRRELQQTVVPLPALADWARSRLPPGGRLALLFGSEKTGLLNRDLQRCHALATVPTDPRQPSMNLGQAIAVTLYELRRSEAPAAPLEPERERPGVRQLEDLLGKMQEAFGRLGAMGHLPRKVREEKLRRKLLRWELAKEDASVLQSFFKRVLDQVPDRPGSS